MSAGRTAATLTAVSLLAAGCGGGGDDGSNESKETLTVLAASSLTNVFGELEQTYEEEHPGVDVQLTFDSSSTLAEQVVQGAPADVLATADEETMQIVVDEGLAGVPIEFARNELILVTPPDNPGDVQAIEDLDSGDVAYGVCVLAAPCGAASQKLLGLVDVTAEPVTEEDNVRDVLTKVSTGEVDAGLVYVSDAQAAGDDVEPIEVPESDHALNSDVIAPLADAADPGLTQDWVDLVTSGTGQQALQDYGFLPAS